MGREYVIPDLIGNSVFFCRRLWRLNLDGKARMNIRDKKVQYTILSAIAGCGLLFLILQFLILPAISSWKENSAKAMEMQKQLYEMRQVIRSRPVVKSRIETTKTAVKTFAGTIPLPVLGNYLLDMEKDLRQCAAKVGVNVVNIADNDIIEISPEPGRLKIYRVRVQVKSGFQDFIRLAAGIHGSNPLISISGINIVARDNSPGTHEMSFVVSWLVWSDPAKRPAFLREASK